MKLKASQVIFGLLIGSMLFLSACDSAATPAPTAIPTNTAAPATATTVPATATPVPPTATPTTAPISLQDGLGHTITLDKPASKVVSLAPSNTEIIFALGAGTTLAGRDEFSNYPEEVKSIASVGGSMGKFDLEAIAALKPDLVLAAELNPPELVDSLEKLGLKVFYIKNPVDFNGLYANLTTVSKLLGKEAEAATLVESLTARVKAVQDKLANVQEKPVVLYELDATDPAKPYTAGTGTFIDMLIQTAGGTNLGAGMDSAYPQVSLETVVAKNPAFIFLGDANYGITVESVGKRPGWAGLDAVKKNQVLAFNDDTVSRPTPRLVDALEQIAKILHPDLFK